MGIPSLAPSGAFSIPPAGSRVAALVSRLDDVLSRPSRELTDVTERQHARLLARLDSAQALLLLIGAISSFATETRELATLIDEVLFAAMALILVAYGLSRTRHVKAAAILTIGIQLALPITVVVVTRDIPTSDFSDGMVWSLSAIVIASSLFSIRSTSLVVVGTLGVIVAAFAFGPRDWSTDVARSLLFVAGQGTLVVVAHVHRSRIARLRAAELQTRNRELEALQATLEEKVAARTRALSERNADIHLVLDNVDQALFTVDRFGAISAERSAMLTKFFGAPRDGDTIASYFDRVDPAFATRLELGWDQVIEAMLPIDACLDQLPKELVVQSRHYQLGYQTIGAGEPNRFLVVVTDVTDEFEREAAERDKRETFALLEHMLVEGQAMRELLDEGSDIVAALAAPGADPGPMLRAVHTLKGNAASYGLKSVADLCHDVETIVQETKRAPRRVDIARLKERWGRITWEIDRLLGARRGFVEIGPTEVAAFEQALERGASHAELLASFRALKLEPVEVRLRHFADQARRLAPRLGKPGILVDVRAGGLRLDPRRWGPFLSTLLHAVRNAVDHGIEAPEAREARGKLPRGRLVISASADRDHLTFEVADDGAGINWPALEARCHRMGLSTSAADLARALFDDGVSTSEVVTDISGRGAGMGALLAATRALGGDIRVDSVAGAGTRIRAMFPQLAQVGTSLMPPPPSREDAVISSGRRVSEPPRQSVC